MGLTKSHNKLDFSVDFGNGDVDLVDRHLHASIELHQVRDLCVQVEIGLQFLDGQFDATNVKFGNIEIDIRRRAGGGCTLTRGRACRVAASRSCRPGRRGGSHRRRRRLRRDVDGRKERDGKEHQ